MINYGVGMSKKLFLVSVIILLLLSCNNSEHKTINPLKSYKIENAPVTSYTNSQKIIAAMKADYRLKPDQRFLLAMNAIYRFLGPNTQVDLSTDFSGGSWVIDWQDNTVKRMPELPDFSDYIRVLTHWATLMLKSFPLDLTPVPHDDRLVNIKAELELFLLPHTKAALSELDALWQEGVHSVEMIHNATRGLIWLAMQTLDETGIGDQIAARALAMLALSRAISGNDILLVEEALLADEMHYSAYAIQRMERLPDHPVKAYLERNYTQFENLLDTSKPTALLCYLRLKQLSETKDIKKWAQWMNRLYRHDGYLLPVLKTGLEMNTFKSDRFFSDFLPKVVLFDLASEFKEPDYIDFMGVMVKAAFDEKIDGMHFETILRKALGLDKSGLLKQLNKNLAKLQPIYKGPFLDSDLLAAYYESYFYSCLYCQGLFYLDRLSSIKKVNDFDFGLGMENSGRLNEFRQWFHNLADAKAGRSRCKMLMKSISESHEFGAPLVIRSFNELKGLLKYGDPETFAAAKLLITRMDARPENQITLGWIARSSLLDLNLTEKMIKNAVAADPVKNPVIRIWLAYFQRDLTTLHDLAVSTSMSPKYRADAIKYWAKTENNTDDIIQAYSNLVKDNPKIYNITRQYVEYLLNNGYYRKAHNAAMDWLLLNPPTSGLENIIMRNAIAKGFYKSGQYDACLDFISPHISIQQNDTMLTAAECMAKDGRTKEAEALFEKAMDRYPDSLNGLIRYIRFLWEEGRYELAAKRLKEWKYPIDAVKWRFQIGKAFCDVLAANDDAKKAFKAFLAAGISHWDLKNIPIMLAKADRNELAFRLNNMLFGRGLANLDFILTSYGYLKQSNGKDAADLWIRKKIPATMRNPAGMIFFAQKEYDLLWDLIDESEQNKHADFIWLLRAAAWVKSNDDNRNHKEKLHDYYSKNDRTYYNKIGRFLMEFDSGENLLAGAVNANKRCELAYYFGLKAQGEGDYDLASDWYHIALETGMIKMGEYRWAHNELYRWYTKDMSLKSYPQTPRQRSHIN